MKKTILKFMAITVGTAGIIAILSGCSQGFTSGGAAPKPVSSSTPNTASAQTTIQGPTSKSSTVYRNKLVSPAISGTTVSLPMDEISRNGMESFNLNSAGSSMTFMAYQLDGQYYVRAAVCVPCGSRSFTLQGGTLICDSCRTVFNATTGAGMSGVSACMSYAKKAATYTTSGGSLVLNTADLATAFQNTINRR